MLTGKQGAGQGGSSCAAGNCHGTFANSLYLTCGDSPEQLRWNYLVSEEYLAQTPEQSELLRRPLSPGRGRRVPRGRRHLHLAERQRLHHARRSGRRRTGRPSSRSPTRASRFFSQKVQPLLVKKGCMMVQCHSATMFHDYRLRGGSGGSFSLSATRKNYELSLAQLSIESEDPNASRIVRKNLYRPEVCSVGGCDKPSGIAHRGGPLLEDFGTETASPRLCADAKYDYDNGDLDKIPAYCVLAEWLKRERDVYKLAPLSAVVYVRRPIGTVTRAAGLRRLLARRRPAARRGHPHGGRTHGRRRRDLAHRGLRAQRRDRRHPAAAGLVGRDEDRLRRALERLRAARDLRDERGRHGLREATRRSARIRRRRTGSSSTTSTRRTRRPTTVSRGSSSRRRAAISRRAPYDYSGPQRTPADPTKPNANLYVSEPGPGGPRRIRQLTFLLNMERQPSFMSDGRVILTAEKRAPGFYQLALRRINLDGGDYHPLYAQRGSIGYPEATEVVELADKDFAAIFRAPGTPHGGGALGRLQSVARYRLPQHGPGRLPRRPGRPRPDAAAVPRPRVLPALAPLARPRVERAARAADVGSLHVARRRCPGALMLVSFGEAADAAAFGGDYDVYVMSPTTGAKTKLLGEAGVGGRRRRRRLRALRSARCSSRPLDEPNGHVDRSTRASPRPRSTSSTCASSSSLLFQNTPTGRLIDPELDSVSVYEDMPPPLEVDSFDKGGANVATDAFGKRVRAAAPARQRAARDATARRSSTIPGGLPIVLKLPDTKLSREKGLPRYQRESMVFSPGRVLAPVVQGGVLRRAVRSVPRRHQRPRHRRGAQARLRHAGVVHDQPRQAPVRPEQGARASAARSKAPPRP